MNMGKRGPAPAPTPLKILKGTRTDRINFRSPVPALGEVRCPQWLPAGAKAVWRREAPDLVAKDVLTPWDVEMFARWCVLVALSRQLIVTIEAEGLVVPGERGNVKNPACQLLRDCTAQMVTIGARFGRTPSDRAQMPGSTPPADRTGPGRLLS